jgi:formylglycine-generating enzyme required for sulfatase activity
MRLIVFLSFLLSSSFAKAQTIDTLQIPGTEVQFQMSYIKGQNIDYHGATIKVHDFWIGVHEVTHDEFVLFKERSFDSDASAWKKGQFKADAITRPSPPYLDFTYGMGTKGGFPAVSMTQQAALRYCHWLYQKTGIFFRLPTEAEWTLACQGQKEDLDNNAWHYKNSDEKYHKVGQKTPNANGLYDMLGNVAEWTLDFYKKDYATAIAEQQDYWIAPSRKHSRTIKGGSFDSDAEECTCEGRIKSQSKWQARDPQIPKSEWWNTDSPFLGFRLLRPSKQPTHEEIEAFFAKAIKF